MPTAVAWDTSCGVSSALNRRGVHSSSSRRTSFQNRAKDLEHGYCPFAADAGKVVEELVERVTRLDVLRKRGGRDARADEDRSAAEDLGIRTDESTQFCKRSASHDARLPRR
jgi:hypothetical protein